MKKKSVRDVSVKGKRVLVRVDYNVPLKDGKITDDTRIRASLPTINYLLEGGAAVILLSHMGRPKGTVKEELRLDPVAVRLSELLGKAVRKIGSTVGEEAEAAARDLGGGGVLLLENVRFAAEEEKNGDDFATKLAALGDIFVNDAFGTAHRAHASTVGITKHLPAVAGLLMEKEIEVLEKCLFEPKRPLTVIFGGAKVSDKIGVIKKLMELADNILIGGGMGNTFLAAKGYNMADSLVEKAKTDVAGELLKNAENSGKSFFLPQDLIVVEELKEGALNKNVSADAVPAGWQAVDIGRETAKSYVDVIKSSGTVIWNGPVGVFEIPPFHRGSETLALAAVESDAYILVGGGDTAASFESFGIAHKADFVSTGGGATLEFMEGKELPGIAALQDRG